MDQELNDLKAKTDLVEYAAGQAYWVDKDKSCKRSTVMRHDNGDKIVASKGANCWIYFSPRDRSDNGTIIDFIQKRQGLNIGQVKQHLRNWLGEPRPELVSKKYKNTVKPRDVKSVERYIKGTKPIQNTRYLQSRGITPAVIHGKRFSGTIRQDRRGNSVFLHRNTSGLCGAELKNYNFTGCPEHSQKGVWHSNLRPDDDRLILCESSIDNLSYHILHGTSKDRHISTAGEYSPEQQAIIKRAIDKMPAGSRIVAAFDNDEKGEKYAEMIKAMVAEDKNFIRHSPTRKDWNDDLKVKSKENNTARLNNRPSMRRV